MKKFAVHLSAGLQDVGKVSEGELIKNVPRSVEAEGHRVVRIDKCAGRSFTVLVKKS